jgi:hypothetical protein
MEPRYVTARARPARIWRVLMGFVRRRSAKAWVGIVTAVSRGRPARLSVRARVASAPRHLPVDRFVAMAARNLPAIRGGADDAFFPSIPRPWMPTEARMSASPGPTRAPSGVRGRLRPARGSGGRPHARVRSVWHTRSALSTVAKVTSTAAASVARQHFDGKITAVSAGELVRRRLVGRGPVGLGDQD